MTSDQNKPARPTTRPWKVPPLVRALMVMCVLGVVGRMGWYSWHWWQREDEIQRFLDRAKLASLGERNIEIFGGYKWVDEMPMLFWIHPPGADKSWEIYLQKGKFHWYVCILHIRWDEVERKKSVWEQDIHWPFVSGVSFFRVCPASKDYLPNESENGYPSGLWVDTRQDWHYAKDFAIRLVSNKSTNEFEANLIHTRFKVGCKPDPRFDFGELVE